MPSEILRACWLIGARPAFRSVTSATIRLNPIIAKKTPNAFIGTGLEERLRAAGHVALLITGVITNNSVEATARMAGNLGFATYVVADATFTFGKTDWDGTQRTAEEVHAMSLANLHGEYCTVVSTADVLGEGRV